ncbi:hypothetical protein EGW08_001594 [Elysia chlorotica]|uniref:MOSC domain-containing protein n=1 Tax=Elysia chlorotica TaxID=188477 RepID=A0A433U9V7_ELYCH|nr:hypothetical protein EGW08_001594 [Elysia chlorotica]
MSLSLSSSLLTRRGLSDESAELVISASACCSVRCRVPSMLSELLGLADSSRGILTAVVLTSAAKLTGLYIVAQGHRAKFQKVTHTTRLYIVAQGHRAKFQKVTHTNSQASTSWRRATGPSFKSAGAQGQVSKGNSYKLTGLYIVAQGHRAKVQKIGTVANLYLYPVKSCGVLETSQANITNVGLESNGVIDRLLGQLITVVECGDEARKWISQFLGRSAYMVFSCPDLGTRDAYLRKRKWSNEAKSGDVSIFAYLTSYLYPQSIFAYLTSYLYPQSIFAYLTSYLYPQSIFAYLTSYLYPQSIFAYLTSYLYPQSIFAYLTSYLYPQSIFAYLTSYLYPQSIFVYLTSYLYPQSIFAYLTSYLYPQSIFAYLTSYLVTSTASLEQVNSQLDSPVSMVNFRPNIVIDNTEPFDEDNWKEILIGDQILFHTVEPCRRCLITTIEPDTANKREDVQPLKLLRSFRCRVPYGASPLFGVYFSNDFPGFVKVGDPVYALKA